MSEVIVIQFQFHKGSINTISPRAAFEENISFNSIKVRLIQSFHAYAKEHGLGFNSIKVRLIPPPTDILVRGYEFQFHKGSINTTAFAYSSRLNACFNSIKVRLIHVLRENQVATDRFNSIKVRLIPWNFRNFPRPQIVSIP